MKSEILDKIISDFHNNLLYPNIGLELEFYLTKNSNQINDHSLVETFIKKLKDKVKRQKINLLDIQKEQGEGQIEIKTLPTQNINLLCLELELIKTISKDLAKKYDLEINLDPTPFKDDCSNALQINLTLLNEYNKNLFDKNNNKESRILLNIISKLLSLTNKNIDYFTDSKANYSRFNLKRNKELFSKGKYTSPVNLSWGYDNRSCAIRVVGKNINRRLEYRIADADINVKKAIGKFLEMVKYDIDNDLKAPKEIYGNAFDEQYDYLARIGN